MAHTNSRRISIYLMLTALGIIACTLFEDRLPPEA
jgi:hypothetical protein